MEKRQKNKRNKNRRKPSKKLIIISSGVLAILLIVISTVIYFYVCRKGLNYKNKITIEAGSKIPTIKDYVSAKDVKKISQDIKWNKLDIKDGKAYTKGEYTGIITYKKEKIEVKLIIEDTTAPTIDGVKDITITAFTEKPDLMDGITASDNSGEEIKVSLEGDYDYEKEGAYTLYYTAKDSSGNSTKKEFTFTVEKNENVTLSRSDNGYRIKTYYGVTYVDDVILVNKTYSLPSNFVPNNLVSINGYIKVVDYVFDAFQELKNEASNQGLNIYASSGYRSYNDQKYIYNSYANLEGTEKADTYSARGGYSEHQTGLAIDLNTVEASFANTNEGKWLKDNCYKYGFIIRYPEGKDNITGYIYEPWHIRYVGKTLAEKLYNNGSWTTMEEYYGVTSSYN